MTMNILQNITLMLFIVSSVLIILKDRNVKLGIVVSEGLKKYTNGKQGLSTTIGRNYSCDVRLPEHSVSRLHAVVSYNPKNHNYDLTEYGRPASCVNGYYLANHNLKFNMPPCDERCFEFGFIPTILTLLFIVLQSIAAYSEYNTAMVMIPHLILAVYILISAIIRADHQPITESILTILLTFYIEATLYGVSIGDDILKSISPAIIGVSLYTVMALLMTLFLKINLKIGVHTVLRVLSVAAIVAIIILNLALAKEERGALNWIEIGKLKFQPSELVKPLLAFVLIVPMGKKFYSPGNLVCIFGTSVVCLVYGLVIRDIGVLLQFGVIFVFAVLLQTTNILHAILMILSVIAGCKVVLLVSTTAASRVEGWMGSSKNIFEIFTASGVIENASDYGYQSTRALVAAFKNGLLHGNPDFDVLDGITASNSDLVTSLLAQKHGYLILYILLALYLVLIINTLFTLKQKNKTQQVFTSISMVLIFFAMLLNFGGTFGVIALTGVVNPCISAGMSSAICYGTLFGVLSSSAMNRSYLNVIREGERF